MIFHRPAYSQVAILADFASSTTSMLQPHQFLVEQAASKMRNAASRRLSIASPAPPHPTVRSAWQAGSAGPAGRQPEKRKLRSRKSSSISERSVVDGLSFQPQPPRREDLPARRRRTLRCGQPGKPGRPARQASLAEKRKLRSGKSFSTLRSLRLHQFLVRASPPRRHRFFDLSLLEVMICQPGCQPGWAARPDILLFSTRLTMSSVLELYLTSRYRETLFGKSRSRLHVHNRHLSYGSEEDDEAIIQLIKRCEKLSPGVEYHLIEDRNGYFALDEPFFSLIYDLNEFRKAALELKKLEFVRYFLIDGKLVTKNTTGRPLPEIPWLRIVFDIEGEHPLDDLCERLVNTPVPDEIYKFRLLPVKEEFTYDLATGELAIFGKKVKAPIFIEDGYVDFYEPKSSNWISVDILRQLICQLVEKYEDGEIVRIPGCHGLTNLNPNYVYHVRYLRNVKKITLSANESVVDCQEWDFFIEPDPSIEYIWQQDILWREIP